jgi:hypothetical protein
MTPAEALRELLERVGANNGAPILVSEAELNGWPENAVRAIKKAGLLAPASLASIVVCPGCEQQCHMPVHVRPNGTGKAAVFIVCDKREDTSRVPMAAELLSQWRCGVAAVGTFVALSLGLRADERRKPNAGLLELGLVTGKKRSQMVCLRTDKMLLELVAGQNAVPLVELVRFGTDGYYLDLEVVRKLVDVASTGDPRYTPGIARREARKLKTQSLHESWRKEYRKLKQRRPEMSDVWHSQQIARTESAHGRSAETIRKHMKK